MIDAVVEAWSNISPELGTLLLASLPLSEARVAIPVGLFVYKMDPTATLVWTFIGNSIPVLILFWLLPPCVVWARRHVPWVDRWITAWFEQMKSRYGESYSKWGAFFLFFFVVIPGIGTGAWGGALLAVLLKIDGKLAIPSILAGVFISALGVLAVSLGVFSGIKFL